jgi:hypothetical protein
MLIHEKHNTQISFIMDPIKRAKIKVWTEKNSMCCKERDNHMASLNIGH